MVVNLCPQIVILCDFKWTIVASDLGFLFLGQQKEENIGRVGGKKEGGRKEERKEFPEVSQLILFVWPQLSILDHVRDLRGRRDAAIRKCSQNSWIENKQNKKKQAIVCHLYLFEKVNWR